MRRMNILLVLGAAVAVVFVAGALACGGWKVVATTYEDDASSAATIGEIRVTGGTVAVEVRPGTGTGIQIHRTARYLNPTHGRPGSTWSIDGSVLTLGDDASAFSFVEYEVTAPAGVRVTGEIGTGTLDLGGVSSVDVKVSTGSITVAGGTGDVRAVTGTGAISLDLATPVDVEATASTGSVDVRVPSAAYRVDASTKMGDLKLGIPNDPNGLHRLALSTQTGRVSLATR